MFMTEVEAGVDAPSLSADAAAVWVVVSSDPRVLVPTGEVADRASLDLWTFDLATGELVEAGLVDPSQIDRAYLSLTPFAAESLGLRIGRSTGGLASLVWVAATARPARERVRPIKRTKARDYSREVLSDDPDPFDQVVAIEAIEEYLERILAEVTGRPLRKDEFPRPSILLSGCRSWQSDPIDRSAECPSCRRTGEASVGSSAYCLRCDRWGLDWILARLRQTSTHQRAKKGSTVAKRSTPFRSLGVPWAE